MFEYNMSKEMAMELLKNRKGDEKKKDNQRLNPYIDWALNKIMYDD